ncbi:pyruvate formate-lyase-activating protein [Dendrosporobacter sp. 1207_IL3150]|uniref:pyruvate formate-lyase-activating protein n=1 Tax=Dendrosporobacter sp. 1207_IL3150 TaxID=3084054 RepID=UPI002FDA1108
MKAYYHSVETFGTVDGRGIRYVLFLSGCTLGCIFCHNPDTWASGDKTITVEEVLKDFTKYRSFYTSSGGGITVSGGEPLLQAEFVAELFKACREQGIHTTLDTSGYCSEQNAALVLPYVDEVLFCLKAATAESYKSLTLADNTKILANLNHFAASTELNIRYVIIPDINNSEEDMIKLAELIKSLPKQVPVDLLPYHSLGREKWDKLGMPYQLSDVPDAELKHINEAKKVLINQGINVLEHHV